MPFAGRPWEKQGTRMQTLTSREKAEKKWQTLEWLDIRHLWLHLVPEVYGPFPLHCLERIWELKKGVIWIQYLSHKKNKYPYPKHQCHRWFGSKSLCLDTVGSNTKTGNYWAPCRAATKDHTAVAVDLQVSGFGTTNLSQSTHVENQLSCIRDDGLLFHLLQSSWAEAKHDKGSEVTHFFHATMDLQE